MSNVIRVPQFFDSHFHGREGDLLRMIIRHLGNQCCAVVFMPNLIDPIVTGQRALEYGKEIQSAGFQGKILLTIKLTPQTTPDDIQQAYDAGVRLVKLYPGGVTTGSADGITNFTDMDSNYAKMQELGMHLLIHGEMPGVPTLVAEVEFLPEIRRIAIKFPRLKITMEHVSTAAAVHEVLDLHDNVSATITYHHLILTINDVIGAKINPHNFCKPIAQTIYDRDVIRQTALSGNPKFRFGSDTAGHLRVNKECANGSAGVYTAPFLVPGVYQFFAENKLLNLLTDFTVNFASRWFDIPVEPKILKLKKELWTIPTEMDGIVPFMAGEWLEYKLVA